MSNAEHHSSHRASTLHQWVKQTLGSREIQVKLRFRGNTLHLLCQADPCPDRFATLSWFLPQLQQTDLNTLIPAEQNPLYQLQLYGSRNTIRPDWVASIYLNQLDRHIEQLQQIEQSKQGINPDPSGLEPQSEETAASIIPYPAPFQPTSALARSNRNLAKQGQEIAIASYLSEALSDLGVGVRVSAKTVPYTPPSAVQSGVVPPSALSTKRLWIACEAAYSPDALLVSEPITRRLRELEIVGYRDAVIVFQVAGETQLDWKLRVDLTPPIEMVKEWARWGDVEAIRRFLNQQGEAQCLQITTASLRNSTLHLFCSTLSVPKPLIPDQAQSRQWLVPLLEMLAPQGIQAAALYGQITNGKTGTAEAPAWVEWLQLPAALHPALAESAIALAQQGDWEAIAFLLHRLLNANLEEYLRTGGIRLQLLPKQDLLHVMSEAVICPEQRQVGVTIAKFLKQLKLSNISGVRIYGRRAGQKLPLWSYGVDFVSRDRLVPEAMPEFAATDSSVGDLISPADQPVLRPDLTPADVQAVWQQWRRRAVYGLEQALVRSHLFTANPESHALVTAATAEQNDSQAYQGIKLTAVWSAIGVLLTLQANWLVGHVLSTQPILSPSVVAQAVPQAVPQGEAQSTLPAPVLSSTLPEVSELSTDSPSVLPTALPLKPDADGKKEPQVFNPAGFTQTEPHTEPQKGATDRSADRSIDRQTDQPNTKPVKHSGSSQHEKRGNSATHAPHVSSASGSATPAATLPYTPPNPTDPQITAEILAQSPPLPTFNSRQFDDKLKLYYRFLAAQGKPPDILILGSSRALRGIDPVALNQAIAKLGYTNATIFNFGINGATAQVADLVLQQVLPADQLPRLIIWADGARAFNSGGTDVTYNGIIASEGYQQLSAGTFPVAHLAAATPAPPKPTANSINITLTSSYESVDRWLSDQLGKLSGTYPERDRLKHSMQQGFAQLVPLANADAGSGQAVLQPAANPIENSSASTSPTSPSPTSTSPSSAVPNSSINQPLVNPDGFLSLAVQFNPATYYQKYAKVSGQYDGDYENFRISGRQEAAARSLLQFTHAHNIPVVFVNLPLTEDYLDPFRQQQEQTFKDFMVNLSIHQSGLTFRDLGDLWTTQYSYFSDPSHLNRYGAYAVSKRLAQDPLIPWVSGKPKQP